MKFRLHIPLTLGVYTLALAVASADPAPAPTASSSSPVAATPSSSSGDSRTDLNSLKPTINPEIDSSLLKPNTSFSPPKADPDPEYEATQQLTQPQQPPHQTATEIQTYLEKKDRDDNWLVYAYEDQQRAARTSLNSKDTLQNATDDAMAKLAGLSFYHSESSDPAHPKTSPTDPTNKNPDDLASTKLIDKDTKTKPLALQGDVLKPLVAPMTPPTISGLSNFNTSNTSLTTLVAPPDLDLGKIASKEKKDDVDSLLDTPGLMAVKNDPLVDRSLMPDQLPGETMNPTKLHQDLYSSGELPTSSGLLQLQNQQSLVLNAPEPPKALPVMGSGSAPDPNSLLLAPPANPAPSSYGATAPTPVRPRVASPSDYLRDR